MFGHEPNVISAFILLLTTFIGFPAYISQIIRLLKTKSSADVSLISWGVWSFEYVLWVVYAVVYFCYVFLRQL
jgi:uncharacterized protein with PQ loop repeat